MLLLSSLLPELEVPKDAKLRASTKALWGRKKKQKKPKDNLDICSAPGSGLDPQGDSGGQLSLELAIGGEGSKEMVHSIYYLFQSPRCDTLEEQDSSL